MLDPDKITNAELRLHMGEMTEQECRTARAAIRWANSAVAALLAERENLRLLLDAATDMDIVNELQDAKEKAEAERDAALAKLGVVSEACRKVVEMGEPHDQAAEVEICAAALDSAPEIVAVVDSEEMRDGRNYLEGGSWGYPVRDIIVRKEEA